MSNELYDHLKTVWEDNIAPGAPFEIETVEVRGVPIRTYKLAPPSLRELWLASAPHADNDYLVYDEQRWTYAQAHREVASIANWLSQQGVGVGDRVAIAMRNYPEWMLCYWAITAMGATVVGMNAWWVGPEMVYGLNDAKPKVLIADQERLDRLVEHKDEVPSCIKVAVRVEAGAHGDCTPFPDLLKAESKLPEVAVDPDSDACVFYTSGTTGLPKGAQLTHRGCVSNVMSMAFWGATVAGVAARRGLAVPDPSQMPQPAALITTPLFHVTANNCAAQGMTLNGGKLVHMFRWDAGTALKLIEAEKITAMTGVPVMSREVINHPDFASTDTSSLLSMGGGGAQLQPDLVGKIDKALATARPSTGYGMTETCGIITSLSADFFVDKPDSAGPAMPVFETKVIDADGNTLSPGSLGELCVRGAQVIRGYLNREEATAKDIVDGWLRTGDVARIDEHGFIFIVDRVKDMVLRGGENVYCAEVEAALFAHDAVAECSAFGVPDDRLGEEVGAAVVCKPGATLDPAELRDTAGKLMAKHKIPRYLWILNQALPRNASGKFLKRELRESLDPADAV